MEPRCKEDWLVDFLRRERQACHDASRPLIVGLQGPQGSGACLRGAYAGKSYTCARVAEQLANDPQPLRVAVLSLDGKFTWLIQICIYRTRRCAR